MKRDNTLEKTLYRHLGLFGTPSASQLDASRGRIRERLWAHAETSLGEAATDVRSARAVRHTWRAGMSMAAAFILLIVLVSTVRRPGADSLGSVDAADGSLYSVSGNTRQVLHQGDSIDVGQMIRSNRGAGAMLALTDGSRVEMRSQSELSLERADDGMRIRLRSGSIIVNATKQPRGHLYVQTKDMTVSVVGTIFLVNAETDGSRVAVIEGEVRVHEATKETKLRPGEQVSSSRTVAGRSVKEEIAWSRQADAHLAILAAFEKGMAQTSGALRPLAESAQTTANQTAAGAAGAVSVQASATKQEFEEASIRPCDPDNIPQTPQGARGGGPNSLQMTPGRLHVLCMTAATLIRVAYGYRPMQQDFDNVAGTFRMEFGNVYGAGEEDGRRVRGGPDWVRSEKYTIEAVAGADAVPDAETTRGPMLQRLLERRLQLKAHIEAEQVPAFSLTVARGGLKIKPVASGACEPLPGRPGQPLLYGYPANVLTPPRKVADVRRGEKPSCGLWGGRNGPNMTVLGGDVPLEALVMSLGFRLGGVRVLDRTGVGDRFNFVLEFVLDENTPGPPGIPVGAIPDPGASADVPRAATIFTALEEQLGLKLEPARAPREFIVIDRVERPSPN